MICKNCGHMLGATDRFCPNCGSRVVIDTPAPQEDAGFTPSFRRTEERPQASSSASAEEGTARKKRHFEFEEFNWDLSGFPTEKRKKTEEINFSWESVHEDRKARRPKQEPKLKGKESAEELDARKEAALKAAREEEAKKHEQSLEEAIFGVKNHEGDITETIRIDDTEDLTKTTKIDKFYTYNKKNEEFQQLLDREYNRLKAQIDADAAKDAERVRSQTPAAPVVEPPAAPVFTQPEAPVAEAPEAPVFETPAEPVAEEPEAPVVEVPEVPTFEATEEPVVEVPEVPTFEAPEEPVVEVPEVPTVEVPEEPVVEVPEVPTFEAPEEPVVEEPEVPAVEVPEEPVVEVPEVPVFEAPEEPVVEEPEVPAVEVPEEPVVEEPEVPAFEAPEEPVVEEPKPERAATDSFSQGTDMHSFLNDFTSRGFSLAELLSAAAKLEEEKERTVVQPAAPVEEAPAVVEPVAEEPAVEEPEVPTFEAPEEPVVEAPEAPVAEEPIVEEAPVEEAPEEPAAVEPEASIFARPTAEAPAEVIEETAAPEVEAPAASIFEKPAEEAPEAPIFEKPVEEAPAASIFEKPAEEAPAASIFEKPAEEAPAASIFEKPAEPVAEETPSSYADIFAPAAAVAAEPEVAPAPVHEEPVAMTEDALWSRPEMTGPASEAPAQEEAPAEVEPEVTHQAEDLVLDIDETKEEVFDPEAELELLRKKVEGELGITLEDVKEEERTEYVGTVLASVPAGVKAYEEQPETVTLDDLFGEGMESAVEIPVVEPAAEQGVEEIVVPAEAPIDQEGQLFQAAQEQVSEAAAVAAAPAAAAAAATETAAQSIEKRIAEDTKNSPKDDRITYHDVFAEEIEAERRGTESKPKNHTFLKILAVILCICIVAEIVVICIKYMAPDSAAAIKLQDIFNSIYGAVSSLIG